MPFKGNTFNFKDTQREFCFRPFVVTATKYPYYLKKKKKNFQKLRKNVEMIVSRYYTEQKSDF